MVCLGLEPGASEWKAQTNPLSYGNSRILKLLFQASYLGGGLLVSVHASFTGKPSLNPAEVS